tara:strand:- start:26 stop:442 length:417 start_codon:yes stop_codon:yes gene_type:complete
MKNITTIILFTLLAFASFNAKAQGDLQFNRAVFETIVDHSNVAPYVFKFDTLVVDSGKTLKITAVSTPIFGYGSGFVKLAGFDLVPAKGSQGGFHSVYPIWLPAGTYIIESYYGYSSSSSVRQDLFCIISGIEFNVVQ